MQIHLYKDVKSYIRLYLHTNTFTKSRYTTRFSPHTILHILILKQKLTKLLANKYNNI